MRQFRLQLQQCNARGRKSNTVRFQNTFAIYNDDKREMLSYAPIRFIFFPALNIGHYMNVDCRVIVYVRISAYLSAHLRITKKKIGFFCVIKIEINIRKISKKTKTKTEKDKKKAGFE